MITSFKIENFKGFCELELPQLSRITLLGGSNNVGKTSVLEAIHIFLNRRSPELMTLNLQWRGKRRLSDADVAPWLPDFHNFDTAREIVLSGAVDGKPLKMYIAHREFDLTHPIEPEAALPRYPAPPAANRGNADYPKWLDIRYITREEDPSDLIPLMLTSQARFYTDNLDIPGSPVALVGGFIEQRQELLAAMYSELDVAGKQDSVLHFLKIIEPSLKSLSVAISDGDAMIYGDTGLSRKIPVAYMGDGISRLLTIILYMANLPNGVVLIDEIENGLHHKVIPKVWEAIGRAAREFNCQVIATTHSFELLEDALTGLGENYRDDFAFIRLDRRDDCVRPVRLDYEMLETAFEYHMEIR